MRLLMIGDVVGSSGRKALRENVGELKKEYGLDLVIANGENAAGGIGITQESGADLFAAGVDVLTMGNHVWDKKEALDYLATERRIVRPANYPPGLPGRGVLIVETANKCRVAVTNFSGRAFMPALDCPFRGADALLKSIEGQADVIVVDFHAEATSEKNAFGWHLAGRVAAVCGTHTHIQTADERILPGGTAYITDLGMTGPYDSIIGAKKEKIIERFMIQLPMRMEVATGLYQLNGVIIDIDELSGEATSICRVQHYE